MSIQRLITDLNNKETLVRAHINKNRHQIELLQNEDQWNQICSSLDTIGDSTMAINSYWNIDYPSDLGAQYILIYGLMQALFLQQDALENLKKAFGIDSNSSNDVLKNIRELRNFSIGHPTLTRRKGKNYFNYISRFSLSKKGFDLQTFFQETGYSLQYIDLHQLMTTQLNEVQNEYDKLLEFLKMKEKQHIENFKEHLLADNFHNSFSYYFEKIIQAISNPGYGNLEFGKSMLMLVRDHYKKFQSQLEERNEITDMITYDLATYNHAIDQLLNYFDGKKGDFTEQDARIFFKYLRLVHKDFVQIAQEIDEDYTDEGNIGT